MPKMNFKLIIQFIFSILLIIILSGCGEDSTKKSNLNKITFQSVGLDERIVYRLEVIDNYLLAATDKGLYRETENGNWQLLGESDWRIIDWVIINDGHWIISTSDADSGIGIVTKYELFESVNHGESWQKVRHNFGGEYLEIHEFEPIMKMVFDGTYLYGIGNNVLAASSDGGRSWEIIDGMWGVFATGLRALTFSPDKTSVWYGGQGGIEDLVLRKYSFLQQSSTDASSKATALLQNPSTINAIRHSPFDEQRLFACAEGGIIKSENNGKDWSPFLINKNHRFYFDLIHDAQNESWFYTAGWTKNYEEPQPLIIDISRDAGVTWQHYQHPDNSIFGGVYSMTSRIENNRQVLYFGLYRGGVMRATNLPEN